MAGQVAQAQHLEDTVDLLRVENLEVVYNDVILVLKGLSLACREGRITALLGANGAGKSTTLKAVSGLLVGDDGKITDGRVLLGDAPIHRLTPEGIVRKGVFQVMEGRRVFQDMSVEDNLRCGGYTRPGAEWADSLEMVYGYFPRLKERRGQLAGYMSGGEQQMLAIGRALMAKPRLLLLDEPSLGLAPLLVEEIFEIIGRVNREAGATILLVEQNARAALNIADFGYIMENGRIVLDGESGALLGNPDVQEFYLGMSHGGTRHDYRDVKHYRRRKRWLG
uniref:ABC transporter ATP-binding protein n=1 Tax=Fundidesulfovibrio putealis TaxID=270496 RepID=A0A7C4EK78_9BACT